MSSRPTTITLSTDTRDDLFYEKEPGDSYEDVVRRLLEEAGRDR